ncbi:coniferyl aldehyde dehydrogenase [Paludibacterium yongneupense]|uniref:coniferyl aldehyde dehydrogenase n=1 Tax=Paludibacterium yongneupense TaxID=400061 RepID=UPI001B7FB3D5|nr:coniferyl aldehyde dehydrogenase [Paludibacterium yongneupense]
MSKPIEPQPSFEDMGSMLTGLRASHAAEPYPTAACRRRRLQAVAAMLQVNADAIAAAIDADFGQRSRSETRLAELFPAREGLRHAGRHLARWMRAQRRATGFWFLPAKSRVFAQPLGVIGIVVPWNYPLLLAIGPLTAALAAGNRAMLKMSEHTPRFGALLCDLLESALGPDVVRVVNGGPEVGAAFCRLPFDHVLFTGSTAVGRHVMRAAADNLTALTLELGGKSPAIVADDADLERVAAALVSGKMLNAGQTCIAPDYVLISENQREALLARLVGQANAAYPTLAHNPDYSAICHAGHYRRLVDWREEARAAGARVIETGPGDEDLAAVRKMPLTLILDCPATCRVMQEEIFGPILPLIAYRHFDEALAYINARPRPLALYLFSDDARRIDRTVRETVSGGLCINETLLHIAQDDLPFGGVGHSGFGQYHGREGFLRLSQPKPVFVQSRFSRVAWLRPPYGRRAALLLRWMLGE